MMATRVEDGVLHPGPGPGAAGGDPCDSALLTATLVAALEDALLAARRLLGTLDTVGGNHMGAAAYAAAVAPRPPARPGVLSRREAEVLRLLAAGMSNRRIAQALCLSPPTVQRHVANIYRKIGAHCRSDATAYALRHGLA